MDFFAIVLLTITILTICGICLFIFICSLQPKVIRYFYRDKHRTYYITATKKLNQTLSDRHLNNRDSITSRISTASINSDKRAYLKILERSVRTGRRIEDEKETNSCSYLRQYINKHLSSTTNIQRSIEI